jgi:Uma2 family endonuclease
MYLTAVTHAADGFPRRAFSADDVSRMLTAGVLREDEKIELIEGDLVALPASPSGHDLIKSELGMALVRQVPDTLIAGIATTLQLADDILVDPDIAVFAQSVFKSPCASYFARPRPCDISLVIEIAASSQTYERCVKSRIYARFGVREFWIIDWDTRTTGVHTGPSGDGWMSIVERGPQEALTIQALPDFSFRLSDIR